MKPRGPVLALLALFLWSAPAAAQAQNALPDFWSKEITWRAPDGWYASAVHATLMPDGRILFIGFERDTEDPAAATQQRPSAWIQAPTPLGQPLPAEVTISNVTPPVDFNAVFFPPYFVADDLFCTGQTLLSDGSVFTAGGTRFVLDVNTNASYIAGLPYATTFDGQNWVRVPADMQAVGTLGTNSRWYTTVTRLPDERLLVTSGYELVYPIPVPHLSAEVFDPATGNWQVVSPLGQPPMEIFNSDYTHTFVLPNPIGPYELLMFGEAGEPVFFGPTCSNPWVVSSQPRPNTQAGEVPNNGASTALLPIRLKDGAWGYANGSVIVAGGAPGTSHQRKLDVYDPVQDAWLGRIDMGVPRHHPVTVNLPDGRMLVVGGHAKLPYPGLRFANYLDPAKSFVFERGTAAMGEVRGYHTVALLLPDGRVLVGGGRGLNTAASGEKSSYRYLYPPYMFRPRPKLLYAPPAIGYGSAFPVVTKGRPVQAVLVGLGAMTHSFDFNQRHVQLEVTRRRAPQPVGARVTLLRAPSDPRIAPPGVYMLFVLNARRTPSQAAIVRLL